MTKSEQVIEMNRKHFFEINHILTMIEDNYKEWNVSILENMQIQFLTIQYQIRATVDGNIVTKTVEFDEWDIEDYPNFINKLEHEIEEMINPPKEEPVPTPKELVPLICPCCGGKITGNKCEYCETVFK